MFTTSAIGNRAAMSIAGKADKGDFIVVIRRMIGGVVAAGAIASGVGLLAAPTAAALPRRCGQLIAQQQSAFRQWQYMSVTYGSGSPGAQAADRAQVMAMARADAAGCYG